MIFDFFTAFVPSVNLMASQLWSCVLLTGSKGKKSEIKVLMYGDAKLWGFAD